MKPKRTATLTTMALLLGTASAQAEGLYISGSIGSTQLGHTIERNQATAGLPVPDNAAISQVDTSDLSAGLAFGYEYQLPNQPFFVGAEAFYNFENGNTHNIAGVLVTDVSLNASYGGRIIGGFDVTPEFAIYGHVGYTQLDFDVTNSYTFAPPVRSASFSEGGISFGIGARYAFNDRMDVFTDYTRVPDVNFAGLPEVAGGTGRVNNNSLDTDRISFGLKFNF